MKRLLALDGGGIRGVFSLCVLERMEALLREKHSNPNFTLADHFHYIAGTSTGAIIATCISWGMPVSDIKKLYTESGKVMFTKRNITGRIKSKFHHKKLASMLQHIFSDEHGPAALGSDKLKTLLLIVTRNATTGSSWPITNNPQAKFNKVGSIGNNLKLPIWQLLRASTAAPTFFPPEKVTIYGDNDNFQNGVECLFEDGGITPYNNPAYLLFLKATLPEYNLNWESGEKNIHIVSIGTGYQKLGRASVNELNLLQAATKVPKSLMQSFQQHQDLLCRVNGRCLFGEPIDSELGDLTAEQSPNKKFTYIRYNHTFTQEDLSTDPITAKTGLPLDNIQIIPFLNQFGTQYAKTNVQLDHLR